VQASQRRRQIIPVLLLATGQERSDCVEQTILQIRALRDLVGSLLEVLCQGGVRGRRQCVFSAALGSTGRRQVGVDALQNLAEPSHPEGWMP
jgi:hypothetical protein